MGLPFFGGRRGLYVPQGNPYAGQTLVVYASGTFSRSSSGTYLTSTTTVAEASTNVLRLEDRGDGNGSVALFEGARTNLCAYSDQLGLWTPFTADNVGYSAAGTSPLGTTTAGRARKQLGSAPGPYVAGTIGATKAGTLSLWAINNGSTQPTNRLRYSYTSGIGLTYTPGASWARYSTYATFTGTTPENISFDTRSNLPNTGDPSLGSIIDHLVWGVQLEAVVTFPSSVIINNSGASATRSADTLSLTTAQYNTAALLTLPWRFDTYPYFATSDLIDGDEFWLFSFGGSTSGIRIRRASGNTRVEVLDGGSVVVSSDPLTFSRHQKLTVTVRPAAGSVTVAGATAGNGTVVGTAWAFDSATLRVGGILSGTGEAFCRISQPVGVT